MEGKYDVMMQRQPIGEVQVKREGLYYRIFCRCHMVDGEIHRLYAGSEKLGVLIPERGEWILRTKVAAKRMKEGCTFSLEGKQENFVPIRPGENFAHLDKLRMAKLAFRDGEQGIYLT